MNVITISNQKGGVGKTTTATNLSAYLAKLTSESVLLVDLDPQGNATVGSGLKKEAGSLHVLNEGAPILSHVRKTEHGYDVLPTGQELSDIFTQSAQSPANIIQNFRRGLEGTNYQWVIIDTPPSLNLLTLTSFACSRGVIVPIQCEYFALEGTVSLIETLTEVQRTINPKIAIMGFLRTMYQTNTRLSEDVSVDIQKRFKDKTLKTIIPRQIRIAEAPSHGLPVYKYDPGGRGDQSYESLTKEVLKLVSLHPDHFSS